MDDAQVRPGEFQCSLFGFKKSDVLTYIDALSAENLAKEAEHTARAEKLQAQIDALSEDKNTLLEKTREVCDQLTGQKQRAEEAEQKAEELQDQLTRTRETSDSYKERLFGQEQEICILRAENTRLKQALDSEKASAEEAARQAQQQAEEQSRQQQALQLQLQETEAQAARSLEEARAQAQAEAAAVKEQMLVDAGSLTAGVEELRGQLAAVDSKITQAAAQLQQATESLHAALGDARSEVQALHQRMDQQEKQPETPPRAQAQPAHTAAPHAGAAPRPRKGRRSLSDALLDRMAQMMLGDQQ